MPPAATDAVIDDYAGVDSSVTIDSSASVNQLLLNVGDTLELLEASTLTLADGITNDGTILLNAISSGRTLDAVLTFSGSQTIGGTGETVISDDVDNSINTIGSTTVTNGMDHTVRVSITPCIP